MSTAVRITLISLIVVTWISTIVFNIKSNNEVSAPQLISIYLIFLIWCFLNNRTMPIGAILVRYEEGSEGTQFNRFISFVICVVVLFYCLFQPLIQNK